MMTWQPLKIKFIVALLLSIFEKTVRANCGGIPPEFYAENNTACCWMSGDGKAECSGIRFDSFPPFPPRQREGGCREWCGTLRNAMIYNGDDIKRFVLTNVTIASFNKDALRQFPNLETISISNCSLPTLPSKLFYFEEREGESKVKSLSISQSKITGIETDAFYDMKALEKLSLDRNALSSLPVGVFDHLTSLRYLYLSNNRLSNLDPSIFKKLMKLEELHLTNNPLGTVGVFPRLPWLTRLYLDATSLTLLNRDAFSRLVMLDTLDLDGNQLKSLSVDIFSQNRRLERIYLKDNQIEDLPGETFSSLCHLRSLDLRNNRLTTPKVGYIAIVFENKNDPQMPDIASHVLSGNPWKCKEVNEDLKEYTLFVNMVYKYSENKNVRHGLLESINIECSDTAVTLINTYTMSSTVLNHFTESHRGELLGRNNCTLLESKILENPACPFITPACIGRISIEATAIKPEGISQAKVPFYYLFIGGGLLAVIGVLLVWNHATQRSIEKRRRRFTDESECQMDASSCVTPLTPSEVFVSEATVRSPHETPVPSQAIPPNPFPQPQPVFNLDIRPSDPPQGPISPLEPESFHFSKSNSSCTLFQINRDDIIDDVIDDVNGDDVIDDNTSENSETEAKELFQANGSDRVASDLTRSRHSHLTKANIPEEEDNLYERPQRRQPLPCGGPESAPTNSIPNLAPHTMAGYETMSPIGRVSYITTEHELLPGNPHRPLPSFPVAYSVMSQHFYESIKDATPPVRPPVNQERTVPRSESNPFRCLPPVDALALNVNGQFPASYGQSQATRTTGNPQQQNGAECQTDEDGYMLPAAIQAANRQFHASHSQSQPSQLSDVVTFQFNRSPQPTIDVLEDTGDYMIPGLPQGLPVAKGQLKTSRSQAPRLPKVATSRQQVPQASRPTSYRQDCAPEIPEVLRNQLQYGAECQEDDDGYLLPCQVQHYLQAANLLRRNRTNVARGSSDYARGSSDYARGGSNDARGGSNDARGSSDYARGGSNDARGS